MDVIIAEKKHGASLKEVMVSAENSGFMLFGPGERKLSTAGVEMFAEHVAKQPDSELLLAVIDDSVAGYLMVRGDSSERTKHRAYIAMGVHEAYRGEGVGRTLLTEVEKWAQEKGISRLELTVLAGNSIAIHLYEKLGYEREGIKRQSLKINDAYEDEFFMSKIL